MPNPDFSSKNLLREFARTRCERSFKLLVSRHIDHVYSTALVACGSKELAEEATQDVFALVARKAESLCDHPCFSGWLHKAAKNISLRASRGEGRRSHRERLYAKREVERLETDQNNEVGCDQLLQALDSLGERDRNVVLLRFYERYSLAEIAQAIGAKEKAVQKRLTRALGRLRLYFSHRGIQTPRGAFGTALFSVPLAAAPKSLVAACASKGRAAAASGVGMSGAAKIVPYFIMKTTKTKLTLACLILGVGSSLITIILIDQVSTNRSSSISQVKRHEPQNMQSRGEARSATLLTRASKRRKPNKNLMRSMDATFEEANRLNERLIALSFQAERMGEIGDSVGRGFHSMVTKRLSLTESQKQIINHSLMGYRDQLRNDKNQLSADHPSDVLRHYISSAEAFRKGHPSLLATLPGLDLDKNQGLALARLQEEWDQDRAERSLTRRFVSLADEWDLDSDGRDAVFRQLEAGDHQRKIRSRLEREGAVRRADDESDISPEMIATRELLKLQDRIWLTPSEKDAIYEKLFSVSNQHPESFPSATSRLLKETITDERLIEILPFIAQE